jgi:DNA-binding transcriptional LysR family regulator
MDIQQLQCFIYVAERLSFTLAARHLYLTQPAVSQQISELEKQLNLKLFIRSTHSVQLTPAGEIFLQEAYAILARIEEAIQKAQQTASGLKGRLNVAFLESTVGSFFPQVVRNFRSSYPKIHLSLQHLYLEEMTRTLELGDIDVGLTLAASLTNAPELTWRTIYTDILCWVMRHDNPLAADFSLSALASEPFVVLNREIAAMPFDLTLRICASRGFTPNIVNRPRLIDSLLMLVEAGEGIALIPRFAETYANSQLHFIELEGEDAYINVVAAWKKINRNPAIPLLLNKLGITSRFQLRSTEAKF